MDEKLVATVVSGAVALIGIAVTAVFSILNFVELRRKARVERTAERRKLVTAALTEFYGPLRYYLDVTKALAEPLRANKPEGFRTLTYLLDPEQSYQVNGQSLKVALSSSDHALIKKIIETEDKIEDLIRAKGGLVDDPALLSAYVPSPSYTELPANRLPKMGLLGLVITHYRVLKMAYQGEIKGEPEKYAHLVYPRELDDKVTAKLAALQAELRQLS